MQNFFLLCCITIFSTMSLFASEQEKVEADMTPINCWQDVIPFAGALVVYKRSSPHLIWHDETKKMIEIAHAIDEKLFGIISATPYIWHGWLPSLTGHPSEAGYVLHRLINPQLLPRFEMYETPCGRRLTNSHLNFSNNRLKIRAATPEEEQNISSRLSSKDLLLDEPDRRYSNDKPWFNSRTPENALPLDLTLLKEISDNWSKKKVDENFITSKL